ncbi:Ato2p [Gigaspora margarita]|uniref:Ato2p n=1 Tax=Gigaspora margarita TaxID=4874 RepID=A0A8H4AGS1_GIGMA|nr:Ato2p [Gigaspora margarita]
MVLMNRSKSIDEFFKQREIGDPTPIGIFAFATTQIIYALYLIQIANVTNHQIALGSALFYGGCIQVLSGVLALNSGKTLNVTILCSYGGFWISFGFIYLPSSGIIDSFKDDHVMTTILEILTLSLVFIVFIFLDLASFTGQEFFSRIGGCIGVLVSLIAWYTAMAKLLTNETSHFILQTFPMINNNNIDNNKPLRQLRHV